MTYSVINDVIRYVTIEDLTNSSLSTRAIAEAFVTEKYASGQWSAKAADLRAGAIDGIEAIITKFRESETKRRGRS